MEIQNLAVEEQIVKTVVKSGNGGAVWVPKDWLGKEVVIILPQKQGLKERIISALEPYLKDIISVAIYGSYARKEQTKGSDVDVLVITKDKPLNLEVNGMDILSIPIDKLKSSIEKYPAMFYQIIKESDPLINSYVLDELKKIKISKENFSDYLKDTKAHIKSNVELLELDKLDNGFLESFSILYSSVLRLRGLFILKCTLNKETFSNKKFKQWIIAQGLNTQEYEGVFNAYRQIRDNKDTNNLKIKIFLAEKLLNILRKQAEILDAHIHDK